MEQQKTVLRPTQDEAAYTLLSAAENQACANCRWFSMRGEYGPYCHLIDNWPLDITPNGHCNRWETLPTAPETPATPSASEPEPAETEVEDDKAHDHADDLGEVVALPVSNKANVFSRIANKLKGSGQPGVGVVHGADGARYMLIVTSNSYMDREGETLTTGALKQWVDKCWQAVEGEFATDNPLLYWHDDRVKMGDIVWSDMRGPFLVEVAREAEGVLAKALFDYVEQHPEEKWGASHRFVYHKKDRSADGVYSRIVKRETTVLPRQFAANPLTFSGVLPMTDRNAYLNKMLGIENAAELLDKGLDVLVAELEAKGIQHKSTDGSPTHDGVNSLIVSMIDGQADMLKQIDDLKASVDTHAAAQVEAQKALDSERSAAADQIKNLKERLDQLETQLKAAPRAASRDTSTEFDPKNAPTGIQNALKQVDSFFGVEVLPGK